MTNPESIVFFVGSGISYDSNAPNVEVLTKRLTENLTTKSKMLGIPQSSEVRKWLKLYSTFLKGSGNIVDENVGPTAVWEEAGEEFRKYNYEELYQFFELLHGAKERVSYIGPILEKTFKAIQKENLEYFDKCCNQTKEDYFGLYGEIVKYIRAIVWYSLSEFQKPKNLGVFSDLVFSGYNLDVFTLNHDILIENLASKNSISLCSGFNGTDYNKNSWKEQRAKINLYKLHGSIDWVNENGFITKKALTDFKSPYCDRFGFIQGDLPVILSGEGKFGSLYSGIYSDLHFRFRKTLEESTTQTIVVAGYGWNDLPYNNLLLNWVKNSSQNRILIYHEKRLDGIIEGSKYFSAENGEFKSLVKSGQIKIESSWLGKSSVDNVITNLEK